MLLLLLEYIFNNCNQFSQAKISALLLGQIFVTNNYSHFGRIGLIYYDNNTLIVTIFNDNIKYCNLLIIIDYIKPLNYFYLFIFVCFF